MDEQLQKVLRRADSAFQPPVITAPAAVVDRVLRPTQHGPGVFRKPGRRYALPAGIAAALLLAVVLLSLFNTGSTSVAGGAERLKEAVERSAAYRGWVRYEHGTVGSDGRSVPLWAMRLNTVDGTTGFQALDSEQLRAYVRLPGHGVAVDYVRGTNTAHIHELNPWDEESWMTRLYSLDGVLQEMQDLTSGQIGVSAGRDGTLDKYTLAVAAGPETPAFKCEVWVDPRTKLVQRVQRNGPHKESTLVVSATFAYDVPPVRDVYDLGAPRDARVVDERPTGEVKALLDRLDRRIVDGFGEHTAVLTADRENGRERWSSLQLFGRAGKRSAAYDYGVSDARRDAPAPEGWPTPTVAASLRAVAGVRPASFHVFDDSQPGRPRAWEGNYDPEGGFYRARIQGVRDRVEVPPIHLTDRWRMQLRETAAYRLWPGRAQMGLFFMAGGGRRGVRYELRRDEKRPGLVGLVVALAADEDGVDRHRGFALWLDPKRDDVPAEFIERSGDPSDGGLTEHRTKFLSHEQTPNGRWYPSEWLATATDFDKAGRTLGVRTDRFHLRVETDTPLPENWYENPLGRLMALPPERGSVGQAKASGRSKRALLGVVVAPTPDEVKEAMGLPHVGLLVESLTYLSPAGLAGVRRGDVLVAWDGRELSGVRQLSELVAAESPGAAVQVDVRRGRQALSFRVELGETVAAPLPPLTGLRPTTGEATTDRFIRRPENPDGSTRP